MNKNRIGETNVSNSGECMTIIEYRSCKDIDVQFEDGTIVKNKTYQAFKKGKIKNKNTIKKEQTTEYPLSNCILRNRNKKIGEIAIANNGLAMEIIDYRGANDVDIQFEDEIIVYHQRYSDFKKGAVVHPHYSKKYNVAKGKIGETNIARNGQQMTIIAYRRSHDIDIQFEDGTVVTNKTYKDFLKGYIRNPNIRIGQSILSADGQKMTIIAYRNKYDLDVQFEDGVIVKNKTYSNFLKGSIKHSELYVGKTVTAKNNQKMTIISYRNHSDLDVQFEDGTIVKNKCYGDFEKGNITNPSKKILVGASINELTILYYLKPYGFMRGEKGMLKAFGLGNKELDIFHPTLKIGIEYDGFRHTIDKDIAKNKLCKKNKILLVRVREANLPVLLDEYSKNFILTNDDIFTDELNQCIIQICCYINTVTNLNIDITKINVKKDEDDIWEDIQKFYIVNRIGETTISNCGQLMTIVGYKNSEHIDVQFEDGTIVKNKRYQAFKKGLIKNPNLLQNKKIGEENTAQNGQKMTIIAYNRNLNIDIQFEDGTIVTNKTYQAFKKGEIKNPNYMKNLRLGEINIATNDQLMEIIDYRGANDIDVQFEDGTIVKHKTYQSFKKGNVANPNCETHKKNAT